MKIYLDNSFLNRPFDDPNVTQNRLEAEILFLVLKLVKEGKIILVNSAMIEYENSLNPFPERKAFIEEILKNAQVDYFITCDYNLVRKLKGELKAVEPLRFLKEYEKYKS